MPRFCMALPERGRKVLGADLGLLQAGDVGLQLVGLLDDQLEEGRRAGEGIDAQVADRGDLHLGLADAGRHHGATERSAPASIIEPAGVK